MKEVVDDLCTPINDISMESNDDNSSLSINREVENIVKKLETAN